MGAVSFYRPFFFIIKSNNWQDSNSTLRNISTFSIARYALSLFTLSLLSFYVYIYIRNMLFHLTFSESSPVVFFVLGVLYSICMVGIPNVAFLGWVSHLILFCYVGCYGFCTSSSLKSDLGGMPGHAPCETHCSDLSAVVAVEMFGVDFDCNKGDTVLTTRFQTSYLKLWILSSIYCADTPQARLSRGLKATIKSLLNHRMLHQK